MTKLLDSTDEALMQAFAKGDAAAFDALYERHKASFYRYVVKQVSDQDIAHDLFQEIWSRIIHASSNYSAKAKWTTWAYRIAHNLIVDHYRTFKATTKTTSHEDDSASRSPNPEQNKETEELRILISKCMSKLPAVQLEAFLLSQETDLTIKMISEVVSASHEAVKTRLRYARKSLQDCLTKMGVIPQQIDQDR